MKVRLMGCFLWVGLVVASAAAPQTALDKYVAAPDANYKWTVASSQDYPTGTVTALELTSQAYLTEKEVNRTVWKHWLLVIRPKTVKSSTGFLFISGGNNNNPKPPGPDMGLVDLAVTTGTVVADLRMVPNQPLTFNGDKPRTEDGLIAYTWDKFLRTGDEKWPLRLPMTKAAVKAMDAVTEFCATEKGGQVKVEKFVVAGGSKRGWTAWTTAAVEAVAKNRVVAAIPFVIDMLNIEPSFEHHWRAYGFWAPAVGDYVQMGIMDWTGTKQYKALMKIEEPFEYRDRLTMPKYVVNAAGDQFFLPDSSQFYFDKLKGPKYLRYVPNADHSLRGSDALQGAMAFYDAIVKGVKPPELNWKLEKNGDIAVKVSGAPTSVKLWAANNPEKRDFRMMTLGPKYQATELKAVGPGKYVAAAPKDAKGYTAYFVEVTWPSETKVPFKFTTPVRVWPDAYPNGRFQPDRSKTVVAP